MFDPKQLSIADCLALFVALQASGRLQDPILFDNQPVSQKTAGNGLPATISPVYDSATGWAWNTLTAVGGVRGKRIDAAIAEIRSQNSALAALIPEYVGGRFWLPPETIWGFASNDPDKYQAPSESQLAAMGMSIDEWQQLRANLQAYNNWQFKQAALSGNGAAWLHGIYRGEPGRPGLPHYEPTSNVAFGSGQPQAAVVSPLEKAKADVGMFPYMSTFTFKAGLFGSVQNVQGAVVPNHWQADVWFDMRTDEAAARLIRSWANRYGANVGTEP